MIQILGLLGMYFDAVVVEVKTFLLLFILALAILWDALYIRTEHTNVQCDECDKKCATPR